MPQHNCPNQHLCFHHLWLSSFIHAWACTLLITVLFTNIPFFVLSSVLSQSCCQQSHFIFFSFSFFCRLRYLTLFYIFNIMKVPEDLAHLNTEAALAYYREHGCDIQNASDDIKICCIRIYFDKIYNEKADLTMEKIKHKKRTKILSKLVDELKSQVKDAEEKYNSTVTHYKGLLKNQSIEMLALKVKCGIVNPHKVEESTFQLNYADDQDQLPDEFALDLTSIFSTPGNVISKHKSTK